MTGYERGRTATYRLYDDAGSLLYVGVASLPSVRFKQHAGDKDWWPQVASHSEAWFDSREEALAEEASAIATENPLHNVNRWGYDKPIPEAKSTNPHVPVQAARTHLRDHIDVGLERGEHTIITRSNRPVAVLVPYAWYLEHTTEGRKP